MARKNLTPNDIKNRIVSIAEYTVIARDNFGRDSVGFVMNVNILKDLADLYRNHKVKGGTKK